MKREFLAAILAACLGSVAAHPADAVTLMLPEAGASPALVTPAMTAAKQRRLYMMQTIQRQQAYGRGSGYGRPPGYGGFGPQGRGGYSAPPQGYYGAPPRRGYYGY